MYIDPDMYFEDEELYQIKKKNRRAKRELIDHNRELFMRINGRGLKSDILPLLAKKARGEDEYKRTKKNK